MSARVRLAASAIWLVAFAFAFTAADVYQTNTGEIDGVPACIKRRCRAP
jgi:hypothetical protein